jgi:hypothetical protein
MSIHPECESCGHIQYRSECFHQWPSGKGTILITNAADLQAYSRGEVGRCRLTQCHPRWKRQDLIK